MMDMQPLRRRMLIDLAWCFIGGVVFGYATTMTGQIIGQACMLYGAISGAIDSLAISVFELHDDLEKRLGNIERRIDRGNRL
jgi:hypothetical protein